MQPLRVVRAALVVTLLAMGAECWRPSPGVAAETESKSNPKTYTTDAHYRDLCEQQLNRIHGAIQEYRKRNRRLPNWLSDLCPEFIHDREILICPYVRDKGTFRRWREQHVYIQVSGDPASTYAYEFCAGGLQPVTGKTCHDYKQRQMEAMGFCVPVVRCFAHKPILNLAYDGKVYTSDLFWEDNFFVSAAERQFSHDVANITTRSQNQAISRLLPLRDPDADDRLLDLTKHYNALLYHLTQLDVASGKATALYPHGLTNIHGVLFDVRGLVHLSAAEFPIDFPKRVDNISINKRCLRIHFLCGAMGVEKPDTRVATFVAEIGSERSFLTLEYGKDVKTRWFDPRNRTELDPEPAWVSPANEVGSAKTALRLYHKTWENPNPEVLVKSLSFVSSMSQSAPFLLAVTLDEP